MEELKKCYQKLNELIQEIENRHEVRIDDFINLDDDIQAECMGDWTENDALFFKKNAVCRCVSASFLRKRLSIVWLGRPCF